MINQLISYLILFLKSIRSQNDYKQKSFLLFFLFLALGFITENYNLLKTNSEVSFSLFQL